MHESGWHIAVPATDQPSCGHRLRGPVRYHPGESAPTGDRRVTCAPCQYAADVPVHFPYRPVAALALLDTIVCAPLTGRHRRHDRRLPADPVWP